MPINPLRISFSSVIRRSMTANEDDQSEVVLRLATGEPFAVFLVDVVVVTPGVCVVGGEQNLFEAFVTDFFAGGIHGFNHTIGVKNDSLAGLQLQVQIGKTRFLETPENRCL